SACRFRSATQLHTRSAGASIVTSKTALVIASSSAGAGEWDRCIMPRTRPAGSGEPGRAKTPLGDVFAMLIAPGSGPRDCPETRRARSSASALVAAQTPVADLEHHRAPDVRTGHHQEHDGEIERDPRQACHVPRTIRPADREV